MSCSVFTKITWYCCQNIAWRISLLPDVFLSITVTVTVKSVLWKLLSSHYDDGRQRVNLYVIVSNEIYLIYRSFETN